MALSPLSHTHAQQGNARSQIAARVKKMNEGERKKIKVSSLTDKTKNRFFQNSRGDRCPPALPPPYRWGGGTGGRSALTPWKEGGVAEGGAGDRAASHASPSKKEGGGGGGGGAAAPWPPIISRRPGGDRDKLPRPSPSSAATPARSLQGPHEGVGGGAAEERVEDGTAAAAAAAVAAAAAKAGPKPPREAGR